MWIAACNGDVGALDVLIRANADVNMADVVSLIFNLHEITLWYINIILSTLLFGQHVQEQADVLPLVTSTLLCCCKCCYLIQYKQTPVWIAACNGHVGALDVLVRAKADVNVADLVSLIFNLHEIVFMV